MLRAAPPNLRLKVSGPPLTPYQAQKGRVRARKTGAIRVPKEATIVELEIYAVGEPTGAKLIIDPASVQAVQSRQAERAR